MSQSQYFRSLLIIVACLLSGHALAAAEDKGELIFKDDFERNESQEKTEEIGNGWSTNSKNRAAGNKQVDLKDGTMRIYIHEVADHGVSVRQPVEFTDGTVEMKFMLEDPKDSLGLNFADLKCKTVHAGHLCMARIYTHSVQLSDLKTGDMDLTIRKAKQADELTAEQKQMLKTKKKKVPHKIEAGKWHTLSVDISGQTLSVTIDGKKVGSFSSEGIAHPTKRMLRLSVPRQAVVDEIRIYARNAKP
ncbi:MAG: hypothetical protein ACPG4Q_06590 [Phycisphaeraceae bacterium]